MDDWFDKRLRSMKKWFGSLQSEQTEREFTESMFMQRQIVQISLVVVLAGLATARGAAFGPARAPAAPTPAPAPVKLISSFERPSDISSLKADSTKLLSVVIGVTEGKHAMRAEFGDTDYPRFTFASDRPMDWSGFAGLAVDVTNPGTETVRFALRVEDAPNAKGPDHVAFGVGAIEPGRTASFVLKPAEKPPMSYGMMALPPVPGMRTISNLAKEPVDFNHVYAWQVYLSHPGKAYTLIFDNVRLVALKSTSLDKIVDRFGQYATAEWPGKLHDEKEFATRRAAEENELRTYPGLQGRDRFGGWTGGPQLPPGKFFRTQQVAGKWWLVDPDGHLFLSFGVNTVKPGVEVFTAGREYMFGWLPKENEPLGKYFGHNKSMAGGPVIEGPTYDFLQANLHRKYGPQFMDHWRHTAMARMRSWGFNTLGKSCDTDLYHSERAANRIAYLPIVQFTGNYAHVSGGQDTWGPMHDPYDPAFREAVAAQLDKVVSACKDDPWCIGYFIDNELSWGSAKSSDPKLRYGLALGALKAQADASPAKKALLEQLKQTYNDIGKLNAAWKTSFAGWDDLKAPVAPFSAAAEADFQRYLKSFATQYFTVVRTELRRLDPNHLYLGCRFANFTPECVQAAAEVCDGLSFNIYRQRLDKEWDFLKSINKPVIIGEFHVGAPDRGMFNTGLVEAANQQWRAAMVQDYVRSVADHPSFVGCHWFRYDDEPLLGHTGNGENYNIGLVSITDTPYPELIATFRSVLTEAYPRRYQGTTRPVRPLR